MPIFRLSSYAIKTVVSTLHFFLLYPPPKNIKTKFNLEFKNMLILKEVYSSCCMSKLNFIYFRKRANKMMSVMSLTYT